MEGPFREGRPFSFVGAISTGADAGGRGAGGTRMTEPQCGCIPDAREHDAHFSSMPVPDSRLLGGLPRVDITVF